MGRSDAQADAVDVPPASSDERTLLLDWLQYERDAVRRNLAGISDQQSRWQPDSALISLIGIVNHLTRVEWRWIDGGILGRATERSESEFSPGPDLTLADALDAYQRRAGFTDTVVREAPSLGVPCSMHPGADLRWVLLHLINETARHAGHADATRELLDGWTGE